MAPIPLITPGSASGRPPGSGPGNLGSNPGPGVMCGSSRNLGFNLRLTIRRLASPSPAAK